MNSDVLKSNKRMLIIGIIVSVLGFISFFVSFGINADAEAVSYHDLISKNEDKKGDYAKLEIAAEPYLFAERGSDKCYLVFDKENYLYVVRLTDETISKLEAKYKEDKDYTYEIKGHLYTLGSDLKKLVVDTYNDGLDEPVFTIDNVSSYVGSTYLDETRRPMGTVESILLVCGILAFVSGIIIVIVYIITSSARKKTLKNYQYEELEAELNGAYFADKKLGVYLTSKYVITAIGGLKVFTYDDFVWLYNENRKQNGISVGTALMAHLNSHKGRIMLTNYIRKTDSLIEIMNHIASKNKKVLIGYTDENKIAYKNLTKK